MSVPELVKQIPVDLRTAVLQQFWNVIGGTLGLVFILVLSLYLLHDAQSLRAMVLSFVPRERQRQARRHSEDDAGEWRRGALRAMTRRTMATPVSVVGQALIRCVVSRA